MFNPIQPNPYKIISITKETDLEWTFRIETDIKVNHGQFLQLSIPTIGECPISVSGQGENYLEFTIRSVGKVTDCIFSKQPGDVLFLRGPYGNGWPVDKLAGKHLVVIAGGTGVSPVRSLINANLGEGKFAKSVNIIAGFKNVNSVLFKPELDKWVKEFNTTLCLDNEEAPGFHKGMVTGFIKDLPLKEWGEDYAVVVVGPPVMMKFVGLELEKQGFDPEKIWMSFERKMSCAIGKCGHCRIDEYYVCLDGPVFPYTTARKIVD